MLKKFVSVRKILTLGLVLSMLFAAYSIYYKTKDWGFTFIPKQTTKVWTIEAHVSFEPNGDPIKVSIATPTISDDFKILDEDIVAPKYKVQKQAKQNRVILTSDNLEAEQNIYYRVLLFDNEDTRGKTAAPVPPKPEKPIFDAQMTATAEKLMQQAEAMPGDEVQKVIRLFNQTPPDSTVVAFLPMKKTPKDVLNAIRTLLDFKGIPNRTARGIRLEEDKQSFTADLMLEAYADGVWKLYNIETGKKGKPENFVLFQRGGESLIDVEGGNNSTIKFSVMKSITSSLSLAGKRAKLANQETSFGFSVFNLPLNEQNTIKWLTIFPLAILVIVLIRNVVGILTMGTFTPMLIALARVKTGLVPGLICFSIILAVGLLLRSVLSRLNLLLVPRISAVVIFVILMMQLMTILGYRFSVDIGLSAVFFPIIIMAWIIERASITWEEEGSSNALREVFFSVIAAIITYAIISNEVIRHIMFVFNELNLVILFIVMLLGTYTGYRLTELKRFAPLVKDK